ncbi:MAG: hypothetical protein AAFR61_06360 [Bacteroidota bacterium]
MAKIAAWGVHVFTASGLLAGFMALINIGEKDWQEAYLWLMLCFVIDGVDGTLARRFRVREVLPHMDGKNIDYVIDFATYAIIPAYFFYMAEMAPGIWMYVCLGLILLSSALYYGKTSMVAEEQFFVGFPVLWNLLVFYAFFVLDNQIWLNVAIVMVFAVLHFVPMKYAYPSRARQNFWLHLSASIAFFIGVTVILLAYPRKIPGLDWLMHAIGLYFMGMAIADTWFRKAVPTA